MPRETAKQRREREAAEKSAAEQMSKAAATPDPNAIVVPHATDCALYTNAEATCTCGAVQAAKYIDEHPGTSVEDAMAMVRASGIVEQPENASGPDGSGDEPLTDEQTLEVANLQASGMTYEQAVVSVTGKRAADVKVNATTPAPVVMPKTEPPVVEGGEKKHAGEGRKGRAAAPVQTVTRTAMAGKYPQDISQMPTIDEINNHG